MIRKFIRYEADGRVAEIIPVEGSNKADCESKFSMMFHPDLVAQFENVAELTLVSLGQVKSGSNFVDILEPEPTQEQINRQANAKINDLELQALPILFAYVLSQADCPQELKDINGLIQAEQAKIQ